MHCSSIRGSEFVSATAHATNLICLQQFHQGLHMQLQLERDAQSLNATTIHSHGEIT
jgi:hypothetical protein